MFDRVFLVGHTDAYPHLSPRKPAGSLMSCVNIVSLGLHILFVVVFQALAYAYLSAQSWCVLCFSSNEYRVFGDGKTTTLLWL